MELLQNDELVLDIVNSNSERSSRKFKNILLRRNCNENKYIVSMVQYLPTVKKQKLQIFLTKMDLYIQDTIAKYQKPRKICKL